MTLKSNLVLTHQLKTKATDGRDLVFLSGTAIFDYAGTKDDFIRDGLAIHLAPPDGPIWETIDECAPAVALAAVYNDSSPISVGWAVDGTEWTTYSFPGQGLHLLLDSFVAVSGRTAMLIRATYQASVLGVLAR
jgi:hypothetical protein